MPLARASLRELAQVVWGRVFTERRREGEYPFDKVPVLYVDGRAVAQSGSIARYAAKRAGCYPQEATLCALNDAVFEMAQDPHSIDSIGSFWCSEIRSCAASIQ